MSDKRCNFKLKPDKNWCCGSLMFNLKRDGIDQGELCDVHYWQTMAEHLLEEVHRLKALFNWVNGNGP